MNSIQQAAVALLRGLTLPARLTSVILRALSLQISYTGGDGTSAPGERRNKGQHRNFRHEPHFQPFARRSRDQAWSSWSLPRCWERSRLRRRAPPRTEPPVLPGPPGLFEAPEFQTDPHRMALAVWRGTTPTGAWSAAAAVFAGEHPRVNAWKLEGPMSNLSSRRGVGASTVFLVGFRGGPAGVSALVQLVTLKAGDNFFCWAAACRSLPFASEAVARRLQGR